MEEKEFYRILVKRYLSKQLSDDELNVFVELTRDGKLDEALIIAMNEAAGIADGDESGAVVVEERKVRKLWPRIAVTAAAVAAITLGTWLYYGQPVLNLFQYHPDSSLSSRPDAGGIWDLNDIAPGRNTATLTLADGKTINLSDEKTGVVIDAAQLTYSDGTAINSSLRGPSSSSRGTEGSLGHANSRDPSAVGMTSVSTPRGGTYQVVLPDGTKVWLNADSKISFPSQFIGSQRKIELIGEAYFEVSKVMIKDKVARNKEKSMPFIVETIGIKGGPGQQVEVLGTYFNINSYADEGATKTTLLEGSVSVSYVPRLRSTSSRGTTLSSRGTAKDLGPTGLGMIPQTSYMASRQSALRSLQSRDDKSLRDDGKMPESIILKPNQQAVLMANNKITVKQIDPELAVAWKNGEFSFKKENLKDIMRSVARWYNVEVVYADDFQSQPFTGTVSKFDNISSVLKVLELTGKVHFKIEGRRVTVMK